MYIVNSKLPKRQKLDGVMTRFLDKVTEEYLREAVEKISIPRHRFAEPENNRAVAQWIEEEFKRNGLTVFRQGPFNNVVGTFQGSCTDAKIIIGAHYDSVPRSPGADDNASAVAGMLAAAKALSQAGKPPIAFVAFNQEEDGLLGSRDFVENYLLPQEHRIELVHILEMIGYCNHAKGSQKVPPGLPVKISDKGNFLAILANRDSNRLVASLVKTASQYVSDLPVKALKVFFGIEKLFSHLLRSDHSPFWSARIPAFMWTDTSEFRNPHYHRPSDKPETLDYQFLKSVTQLLVAQVIGYLQLHASLDNSGEVQT